MEKELKSCTGVLLRAELTGHVHSRPSANKSGDGRTLLFQPSNDTILRIEKQKSGRIYFHTFKNIATIAEHGTFNSHNLCMYFVPETKLSQ